LAEAAVDALRHVNVVSCCSATPICALLSFNSNRLAGTQQHWSAHGLTQRIAAHLCRADSLTELARNTSLFSTWISPEHVFSAEARADRPFLVRIVDRNLSVIADTGERLHGAYIYLCSFMCVNCPCLTMTISASVNSRQAMTQEDTVGSLPWVSSRSRM
jgi:hypothetical protein